MRTSLALRIAALFFLAAFAPANAGPGPQRAPTARSAQTGRVKIGWTPFSHIVVIMQENRTVDNLLNGFCVTASVCADTVTIDPWTNTPLAQASLASPFDPTHSHGSFVTEYADGQMNGFLQTPVICHGAASLCPPSVLAYVPPSETAVYRQLATVDGVLSDATFQTDEGPSFPSHLYAIAGQSGGYDHGHWAIDGGSGSCKTKKAISQQILMTTPFPGRVGNRTAPCKDFETILDLVAQKGLTWRYYSDHYGGFFSAPEAIQHLYGSPNFIAPSERFLTDIASGTLANVTFIMPSSEKVSDHPGLVPQSDPLAGPRWVASLINAIGESPFWNGTAIVLWWDDWGGLYDHVVPPRSPVNPDPFEYGFRVPLIVASAYARVGTIDHKQRTFVSALRLIERTFNLPSLGTTDQYEPDALDSMLNYAQKPLPFTPLAAPQSGRPVARKFSGV